MNQKEISFESGESNDEVVRVGDTVRRVLTANSDFVHKLMRELTKKDFGFSPELLGIDEKGREIITYIPGTQMNRGEVTVAIMKQSMAALRQFHDIFANSELSGKKETVIHTDFAPWNQIVEDGDLVGVIDFDDAIPGRRLADVTYACWNFLDMGDKEGKYSDKEVFKLLPLLVESYGEVETDDFVYILLAEQERILKKRKRRVKESVDKQQRAERQLICDEIEKQIEWVEKNRKKIENSLGV